MNNSKKKTDYRYTNLDDFAAKELPSNIYKYFEDGSIPKEVCDYIIDTANKLRIEEANQAQFVSDVSHEIRTPLTAIRGIAETLQEGDVPQEMQDRFLNQVVSECDRLTRLANDLLTLQKASRDDLELKRINLRTTTDNCAVLMEELLKERGIELQIVGEAPDINGNEDALKQILINLIENASRYAKSKVRVEVGAMQQYSVIAVRDNGPGFGDIDPAHLFDRFYRADQSRQRHKTSGNSGLGLAIVKALANQMNGTVEAANLAKGGAVFYIMFPSLEPLK
ncbi:MAG: HAMP domain-containing histidine kinase [Coriobacteriales bacterium]|nr:HAMP domain-containing histidine kinase [Coriobacteriales bacterium]